MSEQAALVRQPMTETRRADALREVAKAEQALRLAIRALEGIDEMALRNRLVDPLNAVIDVRVDAGDLDLDD